MMVNPEWYYEEHLKDKSPDQIKSKIRSLKRKINRLKKVVESPKEHQQEWMVCPVPDVQLEMNILYLKRAIEVLMDTDIVENSK